MFKPYCRILVAGFALTLGAGVVAQDGPPDHAGKKGKQRAEAAQERGERQRERARDREEQARDRAEEEREQARERKEEAQERAEEKREEARERKEDADERDEEQREERQESRNGDKGKRQGDDMPAGLQKKDGAPQAGKGSETGQKKREENSQGWWKFWD